MDKMPAKGVSPVISVVLILGLIVSIAAIASLTAFNLQQGVSQTADVTLTVDETGETTTVTVVEPGNADDIRVNGTVVDSDVTAGDQISVPSTGGSTAGIVATVNGEQQLVRQVDTGSDADSTPRIERVTGTVAVNPKISGATVEAIAADGTVIDSNTTDSTGNYSLTQGPFPSDTEIVVNVSGFEFGGSKTYASATKPLTNTQQSVNSVGFDFDTSKSKNTQRFATVDGNSVRIIYRGNGTPADPFQVGNIHQIQAMQAGLTDNYALISDIDASQTTQFNGGLGFDVIGPDNSNKFEGSFDGNGYTIDRFFVNRPSEVTVGLFNEMNGTVKDVHLTNVDLTGADSSSIVCDNEGTVRNVTSDGVMNVSDLVGGVVAFNDGGRVLNSSSSATVKSVSGDKAGGLVGENTNNADDGFGTGVINNSYATGNVIATSAEFRGQSAGGLAGANKGNITNSFATGDVTGDKDVGGLVGANLEGNVSNSYATGDLSGEGNVGGLVGQNSGGTVENTFANGSVTGSSDVGSLVGVNKEEYGGGNAATLSESYFDNSDSGSAVGSNQGSSTVGSEVIGLSTSQMQGEDAKANMGAFDFQNGWETVPGEFPVLQSIDKRTQLDAR